MNAAVPRTDRLRERLLSRELDDARTRLPEVGPAGLVERALDVIEEALAAQTAFDNLVTRLDATDAEDRVATIASYLKSTVSSSRSLDGDLRELRRGSPGVLDVAALGERVTQRVYLTECRAESLLVVARLSLSSGAPLPDLSSVLLLAEQKGRWSRRVEALLLSRRLSRIGVGELMSQMAIPRLLDLTAPEEHRWVQVAALAALAEYAPPEARRVATQRLRHDRGGDDFLVRERIVALSFGLRKRGWRDLVRIAHDDASEHVRLTAARAERVEAELVRLAAEDVSHRVRALSLLCLAKRYPKGAFPTLERALDSDQHDFVVRTAAEVAVYLSRRHAVEIPVTTRRALYDAASRGDASGEVRAACAGALLEIDVRGSALGASLDELIGAVRRTPVSQSTTLNDERMTRASDDSLGRMLSVVARDDFGVNVDRTNRGIVLYRGERRTRSLWRIWFELTHPGPSKRQAFKHSLGKKPRGALRAPPGRLAEIAATRVPGERVLPRETEDSGRHLPLVDDLLSVGLVRPRALTIASPHGLTNVAAAKTLSRRIRAWAELTFRYAKFAELRQRALSSSDPLIQASYAREVEQATGMTFELVPYAFDVGSQTKALPLPAGVPPARSRLQASSALVLPVPGLSEDAIESLRSAWDDFAAYASSPSGNRLSHLAAFGALILSGMIVRGIAQRHRIEAERQNIPFVIGGWGTRGKSGTERLKAALFHGLGYECLVKTTGCEAMFIHAIPGLPASEIFIHRPYDKVTVWEQREMLSLASRLRVRVFLWECMALQPELVDLLQSQWMHEEFATITNAHPDHEDLQGPTGYDVAKTIGTFVPPHGTLFTSEDQMLPVILERARELGTRAHVVTPRDAELLPADLLARFPHDEHPRNVALVAAMGRSFGISPAVAIAEMADNVVPDLGALRTYPTVPFRGRTLTFINGMGANDRAGTIENLKRSGFAGDMRQRFLVTVVNNRADRVARSEVFADLLVRDVFAHRHVLIGTNVDGLLGFIRVTLERYLAEMNPCRDLPEDPDDRKSIVRARIRATFGRLGVFEGEGDAARGERPRLLEVLALVDQAPSRVTEAFNSAYRTIFFERLLPIRDPDVSGDAIIEQITEIVPPGAHAWIIGLQNIKGAGLDFVYRWVSIASVVRTLEDLEGSDSTRRLTALNRLLVHDDYGIVDATLALSRVEAASQDGLCPDLPYETVLTHLREVTRAFAERASRASGQGQLRRAGAAGRAVLDAFGSIGRRREARRVLALLSEERISHSTAARAMRSIVARSKGPKRV